MRHFNVAGPCQADVHYMLPSEARSLALEDLIERRQYFVLHAPRQVGKTTALLGLAERLTCEGKYASILLSVEAGNPFPDDPDTAHREILSSWQDRIRLRLPEALHPPWIDGDPPRSVGSALAAWARVCPLPLAVFLDEIDGLSGTTLLSVLRQIRAGFPDRPKGFPQSIGLCGMRDVRDYKLASGGSERLDTASPFNIKSESLTLRNFDPPEVRALLGQHTEDTSQRFEEEAIARIFFLTQGQPWLVNALARECVERLALDVRSPITREHVEIAKENLILRRDTHLDSLAKRLREDRVRRVIEPVLAGGLLPAMPDDDRRYALDLGLIRRGASGALEIANPIYREVIPRVLADPILDTIPALRPSWLRSDGTLDEHALLSAFVGFWRQHGEALAATAAYPEIAPHLVLMAFLHRVVNGGGTIDREYAIGSGRMDLCVRFRGSVLGIEIKRWYDQGDPTEEGLVQLDEYLEGLGLSSGWLFVFDQRKSREPVASRVRVEERTSPGGRTIALFRG